MIQHIALVYAADDTLTSTEKHLLGAYCNHTDGHGYCWPGIERLCDETNMSRATVKRANATLKKKGLIKSVRRVNPKTKEPITNLTRVNVTLLASLRRPERTYNDNLMEAITFNEPDETPSDLLKAQNEPDPRLTVSPTPAHHEPDPGLTVSPKTSSESSEEPSSPPSPPHMTGNPSEPTRREDEIPNDGWERAHALVKDSVRRWPRNHRAPSARDAHRLAERVAGELADGGDEGVILHELTRDLQDAGSAVRVILGSRTTAPGWGQPSDPRPDHARYEVRTSTPWCGRCDERTRQLVAVGDQGEERMLRCRHCHPDAAPAPAPVTEDVQEDEDAEEGEAAAPDPEVAQRMQAELEAKSAAAREKREQQLAATKKMLAEVRAGASTEAAAREKRSSRNRRP